MCIVIEGNSKKLYWASLCVLLTPCTEYLLGAEIGPVLVFRKHVKNYKEVLTDLVG